MVQADPVHVLTTVARLVAEAASLRDIVPRLAVTLRPSIPFERLHVLQLDRAESFVLYVARETGALEIREHRVGDPPTSVDEGPDSRSRILCTVRQGARVHGAVWLTSSVDEAFEPSHQILMDSVVDLLGLAFEHTAIIDREILRRERIDSLRGLLHTMAGALDIRHVFTEISDVVRGGLPHDILVITQWGPDGASFRLYAVAGAETDAELLEPKVLTGDDRLNLNRDAYVIHDAEAEVPADTIRGKIFRRFGVRSSLDGRRDIVLTGVSRNTERLVMQAITELLGPVQNPRYLLVRESRLGFRKRSDYHAVPTLLGARQERAEAFAALFARRVGSSRLVYTRTPEGRRMLLRARAQSFAAGFQRNVDRRSAWL